MRVPIELSKVLDRGGNPTVRELLSNIVFNPSNGKISLNGARIIMQRATVSSELRRELISLLGQPEARIFLMRLGFLSGQADARFVRASWPNLEARDAFTAGTRLHTFSGVVRVETVYNTYDFRKKKLTAEFLWHDSLEAAEFKGNRPSPDPICWTQLGYASGYASEFFDALIVYKEIECAGQGHSHCRVVGKHAEGWGADDPDVALFRDRIIAPVNPSSAEPMSKSRVDSAGRALSDLDRLLLHPIRADLDQMAPMALPVLISGAPGTGRSRAANFLHQASGIQATDMRRIFGAQVDLQFCAEIARPGKGTKRNRVRDTILIEDVDTVSTAIQLQLARSIEEGIFNTGPRIIAISDEDTASTTAGLAPELRSALGAMTVRVPRFSDRAEDLADIANALLPILAARMNLEPPGFDAMAERAIADHAWPGNLHEMRAVLSAVLANRSGQAPISAQEIKTRIPLSIKGSVVAPMADLVDRAMEAPMFSLPDFERLIYLAALERADGNFSAAARMLGVSRAQFAYRVNVQGEPGAGKG